MIEHLQPLIEAGIDSLKIEGIMHVASYIVKVTKLYRQEIDLAVENKSTEHLLKRVEALQPKTRPLDTGFYFKEQIY